jgi:dynein heavy chain
MNELMKKMIEKHFPEDQEFIMRDPLLFGDYSNAMNESRSRIYEDLLDYDAIYYLFQEVGFLDETSHMCLKFMRYLQEEYEQNCN